ncbi:MAG TPA: type III polyketide synthase [Trueperaceae bacterium]
MPAYLNAVASAVPSTSYSQDQILEVMKAWHGEDRRVQRLLNGIYRASAIERRHSVLSDFLPGDPGGFFYDPRGERFLVPSTGERNRRYQQEAGRLAGCAASEAMSRTQQFGPDSITHLVTASCTGFFAPGPDIELVDSLRLSPGVERYHLGFMGCYAAFPALRMARSICLADPDAVVLVVALELCTLHLQASRDADSLLAASVFADGCAAALVSGREPETGFRLDRFGSALARERSGEMAWTIGDSGFEMVLSSKLPLAVEEVVGGAVAELLDGDDPRSVEEWAVHPGGRAILDRVEGALCLGPGALWASRQVLASYGNMSSATVMFVLERLLAAESGGEGRTVALAFGPGLSVESALFTRTG